MGRKRTLTDEERAEHRKVARSNYQRRMSEACDKTIQEIQENPPHLICWLRGGINLERANKIREEIEGDNPVTFL